MSWVTREWPIPLSGVNFLVCASMQVPSGWPHALQSAMTKHEGTSVWGGQPLVGYRDNAPIGCGAFTALKKFSCQLDSLTKIF